MGNKSSKAKPQQIQKASSFFAIRDRFETIADIQAALRGAGLEGSQLMIAIDCTQSNTWTGAKSFGGRCLHDIQYENPYQSTIRVIGETLAPFDADGMIPVMGFGDIQTGDHSYFYFHPPERPCFGFNEVLGAYYSIIPNIRLSGPTSFAPVINNAIQLVKAKREYTILLILTDGCVTSVNDTSNAIVEASKYPISIVCVGIGDGPFDMMREFDDALPKRKFDNFQFVEYNKVGTLNNIADRNVAFSVMALQEIPDQYKMIVKLGLLG